MLEVSGEIFIYQKLQDGQCNLLEIEEIFLDCQNARSLALKSTRVWVSLPVTVITCSFFIYKYTDVHIYTSIYNIGRGASHQRSRLPETYVAQILLICRDFFFTCTSVNLIVADSPKFSLYGLILSLGLDFVAPPVSLSLFCLNVCLFVSGQRIV